MNSSAIRFSPNLVIDEREVSAVEGIYRDKKGVICSPKTEGATFWATEINVKGNCYFVQKPVDKVLKMINWWNVVE